MLDLVSDCSIPSKRNRKQTYDFFASVVSSLINFLPACDALHRKLQQRTPKGQLYTAHDAHDKIITVFPQFSRLKVQLSHLSCRRSSVYRRWRPPSIPVTLSATAFNVCPPSFCEANTKAQWSRTALRLRRRQWLRPPLAAAFSPLGSTFGVPRRRYVRDRRVDPRKKKRKQRVRGGSLCLALLPSMFIFGLPVGP